MMLSPEINQALLGVVLCGGRATRMGGMDKGLIDFNGKPLASYGVNAFQECAQTVINANRNHSRYQSLFNLPVISDANQLFEGPLSGMLSALRYAKEYGIEWVISAPCDAPFITPDYVNKMWHAKNQINQDLKNKKAQEIRIFMAKDDYRQPVFSLLHISLIDELSTFLSGGEKKIIIFFENMGYQPVLFKNSQLFVNLNTQESIVKSIAQTDLPK